MNKISLRDSHTPFLPARFTRNSPGIQHLGVGAVQGLPFLYGGFITGPNIGIRNSPLPLKDTNYMLMSLLM